jgi:HAD superfamily hydrolase (TIGR01509 family)
MVEPKGVILDLDGTLLDSEGWHKVVEAETLRRFGIETSPAALERYTGLPYAAMIADLNDRHGTNMSTDSFLEAHRPGIVACVRDKMRLFADVAPFLASLEVPAALATNSMAWYCNAVSEKFPVMAKLSARACGGDVERGKPDPALFILAAERLGLSPVDCIAYEDSPAGVASAKSAGCFTVGVIRGCGGGLDRADQVQTSLTFPPIA